MTDETAPFPVPDDPGKKPRRRRGGARHKKPHPAAQEEPRRSLEAVAATLAVYMLVGFGFSWI